MLYRYRLYPLVVLLSLSCFVMGSFLFFFERGGGRKRQGGGRRSSSSVSFFFCIVSIIELVRTRPLAPGQPGKVLKKSSKLGGFGSVSSGRGGGEEREKKKNQAQEGMVCWVLLWLLCWVLLWLLFLMW